jgi:hypothetical protein
MGVRGRRCRPGTTSKRIRLSKLFHSTSATRALVLSEHEWVDRNVPLHRCNGLLGSRRSLFVVNNLFEACA